MARYYTPSGRLIQRPYEDRDEYLRHWGDSDVIDAEPDTAGRPLHYTLNEKRIVYGGGGIRPDITIPDPPAPNEVQSKLEASRLFFEFANEYATRTLDKDTVAFKNFLHEYRVDDDALEEFYTQALATDIIEITRDELEENADYIRTALKRELAGNLWGQTARYRVYLQDDEVVADARSHFSEAEMMARVYIEAVENQR